MLKIDVKEWAKNSSPRKEMVQADTWTSVEQLVQAVEAARVDLTSNYDDWLRCGFALANEFNEAGRTFFHRLSSFYSGYNPTECDRKYDDCLRDPSPQVGIGTLFYRAEQAGVRWKEHGCQTSHLTKATKAEQNDGKKSSKKKVIRSLVVEEYIRKHFNDGKDFHFNVLSRKLEIHAPQKEWQSITDKLINTIACDCSKECGANISPNDVYMVLQSHLIDDYHPLREWLFSLPEYVPEEGKPSPIEELAKQVTVQGDADLWRRCFKKWFVAAVASWIKDEVVNHSVLVLIGPQGIFKTTWLERLMPPELRAYVTKLASGRELTKDERLRLTEAGYVNLDEIDSMSPKELNQMKSLVTTGSVDERAAYARAKEQRPRVASLFASGNNKKFLSDETGNRRWLAFEVKKIQSPFNTVLDYEAIYSEALYLIEHDFHYWFTPEDTQAMLDHTEEFRAQTAEEELLPIYFTPAEPGDLHVKAMAAAEIQKILILNGSISRPMPPNRFGGLLQKYGFVRRPISGSRRGYLVVERTAVEVQEQQKRDVENMQKEQVYEEVMKDLDVPDASCASTMAEIPF